MDLLYIKYRKSDKRVGAMNFPELEKFVNWCSDCIYNGVLQFPFCIKGDDIVFNVDDKVFCAAQLILYGAYTVSDENRRNIEYGMRKANLAIQFAVKQARRQDCEGFYNDYKDQNKIKGK